MDESFEQFRTGVFAILGEPNVGKSTFLNRAVGQKIVITSPKPQTTRDKIAGILTDDTSQLVFLDTPGIVPPSDLLHEALMYRVNEALEDVDGAIHLRDATRPEEAAAQLMAQYLAQVNAPVIEVWNKIDRLSPDSLKKLQDQLNVGGRAIHFISALTGDGVPQVIKSLRALAPEGPPLYSPDDLSDRDLRFLVAEIVREKVFALTQQEIPYSVATQTEEFIEHEDAKDYVLVHVFVEQESQKGIVIGKGGTMLRQIGAAARPEIEELTGHGVFLELRVKVRKNWTKHPEDLKQFGYTIPRKGRRR